MDDAKPPAPPKPSQFMDIVPANRKVPDASSRPLVVTNQPEQKDPMLQPPAPTAKTFNITTRPEIPEHASPDPPKVPIPEPPKPPTPAPKPEPEASISSDDDVPEPPKPATPPAPKPESVPEPPAPPSKSEDKAAEPPAPKHDEDMMKDMKVELPNAKVSNAVVVHHSYTSKTLRSIVQIIFILLLLVIIFDLLLDLNYLKLNIWHTNFFG